MIENDLKYHFKGEAFSFSIKFSFDVCLLAKFYDDFSLFIDELGDGIRGNFNNYCCIRSSSRLNIVYFSFTPIFLN